MFVRVTDDDALRDWKEAGLLYWRHPPIHTTWRLCPTARVGTKLPPGQVTEERLQYAVSILRGAVEYAILVEE